MGFDYAADGEKSLPFSQEFKSLGLQFDLKRASESCFTLGHTESRRRELLEQLDILLHKEDALVNTKELERLHGRCLLHKTNFPIFSLELHHFSYLESLERGTFDTSR